jgi:hypothetical protein
MNQHTGKILYKIDRTARPVLIVMSGVCLLLLCAASFDTPLRQILLYALYVSAGIFFIAMICRICLSPFVKSDEEEEFEQKVDYIIQIIQKRQTAQTGEKPYSPLRHVSQDQEEQIKQLLRTLPDNPQKPGHINLAIVSQYLTALQQLEKADLEDKYHLRLWVAEVTGKEVPNSSQFNEAIPSQTFTKISAARKKLETALEII